MKRKSCYPSQEAAKNLQPKCEHHYWDCGYGFCKLTGKGVNPETCGQSYEWERKETTKQ